MNFIQCYICGRIVKRISYVTGDNETYRCGTCVRTRRKKDESS